MPAAEQPKIRFRRLAGILPSRFRLRCRSFVHGEQGESLIAFAITASLLFLFILGMTQVCLGFYTWQWISECAREGTRYAIVHGATCQTAAGVSCEKYPSDIESYVKDLGFPDVGGGTLSVVASFPNSTEKPDNPVEVQVSYTFPYNLPFVPSRLLTMTSTSVMTIVQ